MGNPTILRHKLTEKELAELLGYVTEKVKEELSELATEDFVASKISDAKFSLIIWCFGFWVSQLAANFAFIKFFK